MGLMEWGGEVLVLETLFSVDSEEDLADSGADSGDFTAQVLALVTLSLEDSEDLEEDLVDSEEDLALVILSLEVSEAFMVETIAMPTLIEGIQDRGTYLEAIMLTPDLTYLEQIQIDQDLM
jgi:hypothetical protein